VLVRKGRFGPYVQHGNMVANLPRDLTMDDVTLEQAVAMLAEKGKTLKPRGFAARKGGKSAKPAAKPAEAKPAKAPVVKKAAPKKKPAVKKPAAKKP
jgi:DNA topoisomerase-1